MKTRDAETSRSAAPVRWLRGVITRSLTRPLRRGPEARRFRAAIVKVDRLGDFVLAVSAIRQLLAHYGEEQCVLLVAPQAELFAAREFPRTARVVLPAAVGHKRLFWEGLKARAVLRGVSCEEVVCLRHQRWDWDELLLSWLGGRRCHVLDDAVSLGSFAARNTYALYAPDRVVFEPPPAWAETAAGARWCRELWMHRQLLAGVTGREVAVDEVLPRFDHLGRGPALAGILVSPLGSHAIRDFPEALLAESLRLLRQRTPSPIRLLGDAGQRAQLLGLAERLRAAGLDGVECAPATKVVEFAEAVGRAELVLTVETSTAHLAAALDRPAIVLIGGGHFGQFGPWRRSARQAWLTHPMNCFGCNWRCGHPEPYCLTRIAPDAVRAAIAQVLPGGGSP
jgi:ADP-heptose:LPS heptosyltransferase